MRVTF